MSDPFIGEIKIVGFNFAPRGWAKCDGQLLPINQNTALFSLLGTIYGGDGRTTFGLPDLRGRAPIHSGQGPGLTDRRQGETSGTENVTLTTNQLPAHSHTATTTIVGNSGSVTHDDPTGNTLARAEIYTDAKPDSKLNGSAASTTISNTGGSQAHNNMPPYLVLNFVIALAGIFPPRS